MSVSTGTIARTMALAVALINQVLTVFGYNIIDIAEEDINTLIATAFTVWTAIAAWWRNNSYTKAAIEADRILDEIMGC